tara:strand:+ start:499 stop:909 length:411 start_codon:yes stop_codon:yes gene_type:complete
MTNNDDFSKELNRLKEEINELRKVKIDSFDTYWEDNNHQHVKMIMDILTEINKKSVLIQETVEKVTDQSANFENAAPYIADYLMRAWNETQLILAKIVPSISEKIEDLDVERATYMKKLVTLESKINKLALKVVLK